MQGSALNTRLKIEYYGYFREQAQKSSEEYITQSTTINALLQEIQTLHNIGSPASHASSGVLPPTFLVAINANLIQRTRFNNPDLFKDGDTVAIMPPFAGG
jgi:molybdopterin converting factor small subunit